MEKKILTLIPAFNEEKSIPKVIAQILESEPALDILIIDDCSQDNTARIAEECGVKVVSLPVNLGYGGALQTGYKYALANNYDIVVQMDGDGQHDPRFINNLISAIEKNGADIVIGSRFLGKLRKYKSDPLRQLGMSFFRLLIYLIIKRKITDPTSGYQALTKSVVEFFAKGNHFPADYPDADMVILLHYAGFRIVEIPVVMYENETGKSMHSGFKPAYYIIKMLLSIFIVTFGEYRRFLRR